MKWYWPRNLYTETTLGDLRTQVSDDTQVVALRKGDPLRNIRLLSLVASRQIQIAAASSKHRGDLPRVVTEASAVLNSAIRYSLWPRWERT